MADQIVSIVRVQYQGEEDLRRFAAGLVDAEGKATATGRKITAALDDLSKGTRNFAQTQEAIVEILKLSARTLDRYNDTMRRDETATLDKKTKDLAASLNSLDKTLENNNGKLKENAANKERLANASARVLSAADRENAALKEQQRILSELAAAEQRLNATPIGRRLGAIGYTPTAGGRPQPPQAPIPVGGTTTYAPALSPTLAGAIAAAQAQSAAAVLPAGTGSRRAGAPLPPAFTPPAGLLPAHIQAQQAHIASLQAAVSQAAANRASAQQQQAAQDALARAMAANTRLLNSAALRPTVAPGALGGAAGGGRPPIYPVNRPSLGGDDPTGGGGFVAGVRQGLLGGRSPAYQVGQAARFSLLYGSMYRVLGLIGQTFQTSLNEAINFEKSLTELAVTTDKTRESQRDLANSLGKIATTYGNSSFEGVEAGTKGLGVFKALDSGPGTQGAVARASAETVTKLAFITGAKTKELQENIAAIVQAFGGGAEQMQSIGDNALFFEKKFAVPLGDTLKSVPAIASLAKDAGFTLTQTYGIAAAVQSRQAGTPSASSGFLSQILTRKGEGQTQAALQSVGITGGTLANQLERLSKILPDLSSDQQQRIASAFGKGRSQSAAIGLIQELPRVLELAKQADAGAASGLTDTQAEARMKDIGGMLRTFQGDFFQFSKTFGEAGLLDVVGGVVVVFDQLLKATTGFLEVWNLLPRAVRDVLIGLGALALASKIGAGSAVAGRFAAGLGLLGVRAPGDVGRAVRGGSIASVGRAGLSVLGLNPVVAGALALAVTLGVVNNTLNKYKEATQASTQAMIIGASTNVTVSESLKATADAAVAAAKERRKDDGSLATLGFGGTGAAEQAGIQDRRAALYRAQQKRVEDAAKDTGSLSAFGDFSSGAVKEAFDALNVSGTTALDVLLKYTRALDEHGKVTAQAQRESFDPALFVGGIAAFAGDVIQKTLGDTTIAVQRSRATGGQSQRASWESFTSQENAGKFGTKAALLFDPAMIQQAVRSYVSKNNLNTYDLPETSRNGIADAILDTVPADKMVKAFGIDPAAVNQLRVALRKDLAAKIAASFEAPAQSSITGAESLANIKNIVEQSALAKEDISQYDYTGQADLAKVTVDAIRAQIRATQSGDPIGKQLQELDTATAEYAEAKIKSIGVAFRNGDRSKYATPLLALQGEIQTSITGENDEALFNLLKNADAATLSWAKKRVNLHFKEKDAALSLEAQVAEIEQALANNSAGSEPSDEGNRGRARDSITQGLTDKYAEKRKKNQSERSKLLGALDAAQAGGDTELQKDAARQAALADRGNDKAQARAALAVAEANLKAYETNVETKGRHDVAYWNLFGTVEDQKQALAEAVKTEATKIKDLTGALTGGQLGAAISALADANALIKSAVTDSEKNAAAAAKGSADLGIQAALREYNSNVRQLAVDMTNPVIAAQEAARVAKQKLKDDLKTFRGKNSDQGAVISKAEEDVLVLDRLGIRDTDAAQKTAAHNKVISEAQTAFDLGRISQAAYLRVLQSESDRLHNVKNKTQEQIDQMNETDKLLKDAADQMNGQFNLGDIQLPSVYQVRRYMKSQMDPSSLTGGAPGSSTTNNNVTINGTNFTLEQLSNVLANLIGSGDVYTNNGH